MFDRRRTRRGQRICVWKNVSRDARVSSIFEGEEETLALKVVAKRHLHRRLAAATVEALRA